MTIAGRTQADLSSFIAPTTMVGACVIGAIVFAAGLALSAIVRRVLREAMQHDKTVRIDAITLQFLSHLSVMMVWLLLATFYAHLIPALHRLSTALLAGVSLVSVIIGFAAQQTLSNLVAGISLVLYKPFRRGDRLQISAPSANGYAVGTVQDMSLGFTQLLTDDGREIIVANATMAQQTMIKLPPVQAPPAPPATAPAP
jgi:small-conductance mechanosensitive channel